MTTINRAESVSRRLLVLGGAAGVAGATALLGAIRQAAAAKMTQAAAAYQSSPENSQQCDGCALFQAPNACKTVDGVISPSGWCKIYVKK